MYHLSRYLYDFSLKKCVRFSPNLYERCHLFQVKETSRYFLRSAYLPGKFATSLVNEGVRVTVARVTAAKDMAVGGFLYIQTPVRLSLVAITGN